MVATPVQANSVSEAVLDCAELDNSDVIVLGASRESLLQQAIQGNIAENISRQSNCTVPPAIASKLSHLSKVYGLPIDLGQVSLQDANPENIKAMRKITDMLSANSKLLPELIKLTSQLLRADIKLAEFHKNLTKAALKHQEKIDQETAEIFIAMAKGEAKATKLEHRTNVRNSLIEQRTQAYANYYQDSVFGNESQIIDVEYQFLWKYQMLKLNSKPNFQSPSLI